MGYRVDYTSLKNLWQAVANFRREQREERYREERRRESRLPAHGIACIYWEVEGGTWRSEAANLLGISKHGCSFRTAQPLARDQLILIEGGKTLGTIEAVVRHISPVGEEFIIGAELLSTGTTENTAENKKANLSHDEETHERTKQTQPPATEPSDHEP